MTKRVWQEVSASERARLWQRWKAGDSVTAIARDLGRSRASLNGVIRRHSGFAPAVRQRARRHLTLSEREEISRELCAGTALRQIAQRLKRSPSTICRELARNGGCQTYRATRADQRAWDRAQRPKPCVLASGTRLATRVAEKLQLQWSPQQISGWLEIEYPADDTMRVSPETIYRSLFIQARGALKKQLIEHLRTRRSMRRPKRPKELGPRRGHIIDAVSIRERPAEIEDRAIPGHWEGDLLCGAKQTQIATLVERHSRYVVLVKIPSKDTQTVVGALSQQARKLPAQLRRSLTWDRGYELAAHKRFTIATDMQVYFCDPKSPWQRGSNENTNGLLRQYFPRTADLSQYSQAYLNKIALRLNQRPRKTLGYRTPADTLYPGVALTG